MKSIFATIKYSFAASSNTPNNTIRTKPISAKRRRLNPLVLTASAPIADNHVDLAEKVPPPRTRLRGLWEPVQQEVKEMPSHVAPTAVARVNKRRYDEAMPAAAPAR